MNIQCFQEPNPLLTPTQQIMLNRGIPLEQQEKWLHAGIDEINDWRAFGESLMQEACSMLNKHIKAADDICIIVDSDCDGYTSSAILINYLTLIDPSYAADHVKWKHHESKQHGFNDIFEELINSGCKMIISPDGGTNDIEAHKKLESLGIDILVLDHHLAEGAEKLCTPACVVNVQTCKYPNKALTGAGVVWQFCRAYEELYGENNTELVWGLIDLCAIGNIGDMSDYRELETRAIVNIGMAHLDGSLGLQQPVNAFLKAMAEKNAYTLNKRGGLNYRSCAFGIVPFINAITRSATQEEKEKVFNSMLLLLAFSDVESTKRGAKGKIVKLYEEAVLTCDRVKRRQTKDQDAALANIKDIINKKELLENKVLIIPIEENDCRQEIVGLAANKVQAKYQRPCLIGRKLKDNEDNDVYSGSGRNYSMCEIENFKSQVANTNQTIFQAGHEKAFGWSARTDNLQQLQDKLNEQYADIDMSPCYWVDYKWNGNHLDSNTILDIANLTIWGQNMEPSQEYVEDIKLGEENVQLLSPDKHPTLKISCGDVSIMKFRSSQEEYEKFCEPNMYMRGIFTPNKNEWMGSVSAQLMTEDFEIYQKEEPVEWIF